LVTGVYEPQWAYDGYIMTNRNVMLLILFSVSGGGLIWLARKIRL